MRRLRSKNNTESLPETSSGPHSAIEASPGPDGWAGIPEIAGTDYHVNAKVVQRLIDSPKLRNKILGHIAVDEMADQADGVSFNGSVNDN